MYISVRFQADALNKQKNVCSKTFGDKKKVCKLCLIMTEALLYKYSYLSILQ